MTPQEILETEKVQNWLKYLTSYPERQGYCLLGIVDKETKEVIEACCLGAYIYTANPSLLSNSVSAPTLFVQNVEVCEENRLLITDGDSTFRLASSYMELHLRSPGGMLSQAFALPLLHEYFPAWDTPDNALPESLADLNDQGGTWPQIAKFINDFPEIVFVYQELNNHDTE